MVNLKYNCIGIVKNYLREFVMSSLGQHIDVATATDKFDLRSMKRSGFVSMSLRDFIDRWSEELCDYYGEDFGSEDTVIWDSQFGDTMIFVLVDNDLDRDHLPDDVKKKIKRAGKWRRDKLKHKWSYKNPLNRIHGYLVLTEVTNASHPKRTYAIDAVCSSFYSNAKGVGSDLIDLAKMFSVEMGAFDLILEVANEYSETGIESESDEEESDDEMDVEESDDEMDDEESGDEMDDEETFWNPDEDTISVLSEEFWKKCMRLDHRKNPVYNLDQEYLSGLMEQYFDGETKSDYDKQQLWEGTDKRNILDKNDPGENEYGGFWYLKGKKSQTRLMKFYEMHGFKEDSSIHTDWCCFSKVPYPTMKFSFKEIPQLDLASWGRRGSEKLLEATKKMPQGQTQEMRDNPELYGARSWGGKKWKPGSFVLYKTEIPKGCENHPWNHREEDIVNRGLVEGEDYKVWKKNRISKFCIGL